MKVAEIEGIPVEHQRLIYGAKEIESGRRLSEYNIQDESTIHLMLGLDGGGIRGDTITLDNVSGTVDNLKTKIREVEGIAEDQQCLRYCGKDMESGRMLSDYNVKDESTMHLYMLACSESNCRYGGPVSRLASMHNVNKMICRKCYCQLPPRATRCRHAKCGRTTNIRPKKTLYSSDRNHWPSSIWDWNKHS